MTFAPLKTNTNSINSPDGGTGRRAGLKNQWEFSHTGSIPVLGIV